jgi:antitoxin HicB
MTKKLASSSPALLYAFELVQVTAGRWLGRVEAFGITCQGATAAEVRDQVTAELDAAIADVLARKELPPDSDGTARNGLAPSARMQAAVLYRRHRGERSDADMARALGTSWPRTAELGTGKANVTLDRLDAIAAALGCQAVIQFVKVDDIEARKSR